jgi:hypothetical protein
LGCRLEFLLEAAGGRRDGRRPGCEVASNHAIAVARQRSGIDRKVSAIIRH